MNHIIIPKTAPKKILKSAQRNQSVRLLDFHICDENAQNDDSSSSNNSSDKGFSFKETKFIIQMFGINEKGETFSIKISDFHPFFFIKVGDHWTNRDVSEFIREIKKRIGNYSSKSIEDYRLIENHKLYGFSGGKKSKFVEISFKNQSTMNKVKNLWYSFESEGKRRIPFIFPSRNGISLELYESNIPPLLRYFHIHNISPSGWVYIPAPLSSTDMSIISNETKTTTCHYEINCMASQIKPIHNKETLVPYKICSFDIEASSSHGDFPVPKKTYKRLATNLVDCFIKQMINGNDYERGELLVKRVILTALHLIVSKMLIKFFQKKYPIKIRFFI